MTLIHTALLSEAQIFIEKYKLTKVNSLPKVYASENIIVLIGGIGKENSYSSLEYIFENFTITKALNVGIAGCSDKSIEIGELFCTNKKLEDINTMKCKTVDTPQLPSNVIQNTLYDMEAFYFLEVVKKHLKQKDIYIFKIVSDHLNSTIPKKDFVKKLINDKFTQISKYL